MRLGGGRLLATVPRCIAEDVELAVARAREAQARWSGSSWEERKRILLRFHDLVLARQDELLDVIQLESGKARRHAFEEILDAAMVARYYGRTAERHLRRRRQAVSRDLPRLVQRAQTMGRPDLEA